MSHFSLLSFDVPEAGSSWQKTLGIFLRSPNVAPGEVDAQLARFLKDHGMFNAIRIYGLKENIKQAFTWLSSDGVVQARLERAVTDLKKNVVLVSYEELHKSHVEYFYTGEAVTVPERLRRERNAYLQQLFKTKNGLLRASDGFHFVKPSQIHVAEFIRTANVIENPINSELLAFWLLPYVDSESISTIAVDTSNIASIAYCLSYQASNLRIVRQAPCVVSHNSYNGLADIELGDPKHILILMSASTSGNLRKKLIDKGVLSERIITIYFLGENGARAGETLCNLTADETLNPEGFPPITQFSEFDCRYCKTSSFPIPLDGDQFSPTPPRVEDIAFAKSDLPDKQAEVINNLAGLNFFRANRVYGERTSEIFLDVSALFPDQTDAITSPKSRIFLDAFRKKWGRISRRSSSLFLERLVFAGQPYADELAKKVHQKFNSCTADGTDVQLLSSRTLRSCEKSSESASTVIASYIDDSPELMAINRDLRSIQPDGNITYIAPVFRSSSNKDAKRIKSNLTFGEHGPDTFSLHTVLSITLPQCCNRNSWQLELEELTKVIEWADENAHEIPQEILDRRTLLRKAPSTGMLDDLYWIGLSGKELMIRPDFTLLETEGGDRKLSQADIYTVVAALLHQLRQGVNGKPRLGYKSYERAVISPSNFLRLNDAVIQASVLRAARDRELAFSLCDTRLQNQMVDVLHSILNGIETQDAEALMEFLVAILIRKLTLPNSLITSLCGRIADTDILPAYARLVARYIVERPHR